MTRRVHIDRLDLDLRGIAPADAEAAARLLGPALARALAGRHPTAGSTDRLDAGRIETTRRPDPQQLATQMAGHLAGRLGDKS
jgi:hypothetical protein